MTAELKRAVRLANVRIAAWRQHGVPIDGEFTIDVKRLAKWDGVEATILRFSPLCVACPGLYREGNMTEREAEKIPAETLLRALWYRAVSRWVLHGCAHFGALLGPEPDEVTGLASLLLLEDPAFGELP